MPTVVPRAAAWIWTAVVTLLLVLPMPAAFGDLGLGELGGFPYDKVVHVLVFVPLTWAWLDFVAPRRFTAAGLAVAAALVAWGGTLELVQGATGWRGAEWADFAADAVGVGLGLLLPSWWPLPRRRAAL